MYARKIGEAFLLGVEVATGAVVPTEPSRVLTGDEVLGWIEMKVAALEGATDAERVDYRAQLEQRVLEAGNTVGLELQRGFERKKRAEKSALDWIEDHVRFAEAHPTSAETGRPEEVRRQLEAAYRMGKASGVTVPMPVVLPRLTGHALAAAIEKLSR